MAGTADNNGWGAPAKFLPLIVNGVLTAAMLGKIDAISSADAVKGFAIWFLANAVGLYALPNQAMEGWGIADMKPLDVSFSPPSNSQPVAWCSGSSGVQRGVSRVPRVTKVAKRCIACRYSPRSGRRS